MEYLLCGALTLIDAVLIWWIFVLRREIRDLRDTIETRREPPGLSRDELEALQKSLSVLVESLETYTEERMAEMCEQVKHVQALVESYQPAVSSAGVGRRRGIRVQPDTSLIEHREKEKIVALHREGKTVHEISRELQVTASEVDLIIRLTS